MEDKTNTALLSSEAKGFDVSLASPQEQREYKVLEQNALKAVVRRGMRQIKEGHYISNQQAIDRLMIV